MKPQLVVFFSAILGFTLIGCAPSQGDLAGTVSYKGKPLVRGSVLVVGPDRVPKQGAIDPDGTYLVKGVAPGAIKIAISSPEPMGSMSRKKDEGPAKVDQGGWFRIPEHYSDPEKSTLTFQLKAGANSHSIDLN
jgi:hypothetical protein